MILFIESFPVTIHHRNSSTKPSIHLILSIPWRKYIRSTEPHHHSLILSECIGPSIKLVWNIIWELIGRNRHRYFSSMASKEEISIDLFSCSSSKHTTYNQFEQLRYAASISQWTAWAIQRNVPHNTIMVLNESSLHKISYMSAMLTERKWCELAALLECFRR